MTPKPMDIILCSGNGFLSKRIISFNKLVGLDYPSRMISHYAQMGWDNFVTESTSLNKWANKKGKQANFWEEWLDNYDGRVWVRKTMFDPEEYKQLIQMYDMNTFATPYESGIPGAIELYLAGRGIGKIKPTTNLHCSEDGTKKHKLFGFIDKNLLDYILSPAQYWYYGRFDDEVLKIKERRMWGHPERVK